MAMREYRNAGRPPRLVTVDLFDVTIPLPPRRNDTASPLRPERCWPGWTVPIWSNFPSPVHGLSERARNGVRFHPPGVTPPPRTSPTGTSRWQSGHCARADNCCSIPTFRAGNPWGTDERVNSDSYLAVRRLRREGCPLGCLALGHVALADATRRVEAHQSGPLGEGMTTGRPPWRI